VQLHLPDLLDAALSLEGGPEVVDSAFPFVLCAGERRSFSANTIIRDPVWRKKDRGGALRISVGDASRLGISSGDTVRLTTKRDTALVSVEVSDTMQDGHVSLPNGYGLGYAGGQEGVAPNELTSIEDRDSFSDIPHHKFVRARVERTSSP